MQLRVLFAAVLISATEARHYYPYTNYPSYPRRNETTAQPYLQKNVNDVEVVDQKTGIHYNPYSKHHPGRHVCTHQRNVTYPIRTKKVFCKPTYKKYMVRCGTQWCEGVRLVYEKYHKEVVANENHTHVDYTCCPGWMQVTWSSNGCNKPVCGRPCMNGGRCVRPNFCNCPTGFTGIYCESKTSVYAPILCDPPCMNAATCDESNGACLCPPGYQGKQCEKDVDECKQKPCDQICYNTPGSYNCECKENFTLQKDKQTCRKESDTDALEARDLQNQKLDKVDKRLQNLEKMIKEKSKNEVTKQDLEGIYESMDQITEDVSTISDRMQRLECYCESVAEIRSRVLELENKTAGCSSPSSQHSAQSQTERIICNYSNCPAKQSQFKSDDL